MTSNTKTNQSLSSRAAAKQAAVSRGPKRTLISAMAPELISKAQYEIKIVKEAKSKNEKVTKNDEKPELDKRNILKHCKAVKAEVYELERQNVNKIIAFDSGEPWYKIAFKSNLIYEFYVMPHLKEVYFQPRQDNDHYSFSKTGVTSISDIVAFADGLKKRGAIIPESLEKYFDGSLPPDARPRGEERQDIYTFEFKGLTRAHIEAYLKAKMRTMEDLNALILPYYIPQELYADLHSLAQVICDLILRLPTPVRDVYGKTMSKLSVEMVRDINATCNGYGTEGSFARVLNMILYRCAEIQEIVRILLDTNHVRFGACQSLLKLTLKVQQDAKEELAHIEKKGNPIVESIKKAKDFPKLKGVNLDDMFQGKSPERHGLIETRKPIP